MLYKIQNNMVKIDASQLKPPVRSSHRHHSKMLQLHSTTTDYKKQSFFPRTIREWNELPEEVVPAPSLVSFRTRLRATLP